MKSVLMLAALCALCILPLNNASSALTASSLQSTASKLKAVVDNRLAAVNSVLAVVQNRSQSVLDAWLTDLADTVANITANASDDSDCSAVTSEFSELNTTVTNGLASCLKVATSTTIATKNEFGSLQSRLTDLMDKISNYTATADCTDDDISCVPKSTTALAKEAKNYVLRVDKGNTKLDKIDSSSLASKAITCVNKVVKSALTEAAAIVAAAKSCVSSS